MMQMVAMLGKTNSPNFPVESDIGILQQEEWVSSLESSMNNISSCVSDPPLEGDSSDTSLKLG